MALLEILHYPDKRLHRQASAVAEVTPELRQLATDMLETMYHSQGIGLAAVQVNRLHRLIVMDLSEQRDQGQILFNPVIHERHGNFQMREGCLSVPDFYDFVPRAESIRYSYLSQEGKPQEAQASGLLSVCIQHEIDHLDGKLFIDYLSPLKRGRLQQKLRKHQKRQLHSPAL